MVYDGEDDDAIIEICVEAGSTQYVELTIEVDLLAILDIVKDLYDEVLADDRSSTRQQAIGDFDVIASVRLLQAIDLNLLRSEPNPHIRNFMIETIAVATRREIRKMPVGLLADIVGLELLRACDPDMIGAITQIRDTDLRNQLLDHLEWLVGDGFESARKAFIRQVIDQLRAE